MLPGIPPREAAAAPRPAFVEQSCPTTWRGAGESHHFALNTVNIPLIHKEAPAAAASAEISAHRNGEWSDGLPNVRSCTLLWIGVDVWVLATLGETRMLAQT